MQAGRLGKVGGEVDLLFLEVLAMGIQNGPAPEGRVIRRKLQAVILERDSLQVQLTESERLRQDAFRACEIHRQEYEKLRLERDEWKAAAEYQQQQATQLRLQVAALEASVDQEQGRANRLQRWAADLQAQLADADAQIRQFEQINDETDELQHQKRQLDAEIVRLTNNWGREIDERKALQQQVADLQAQLEAASVTPAQQTDGTAERLEAVRRMIGEIWGWYACVECLGEQSAETWEQVGALLGHLQREAN